MRVVTFMAATPDYDIIIMPYDYFIIVIIRDYDKVVNVFVILIKWTFSELLQVTEQPKSTVIGDSRLSLQRL
jgi:hypothetical protein